MSRQSWFVALSSAGVVFGAAGLLALCVWAVRQRLEGVRVERVRSRQQRVHIVEVAVSGGDRVL